MKKLFQTLKRFFFPPQGTPRWLRILPYAVLGVLTLVVFISSAYAWEYTNSPEFCGTACHTMPPEYTSYLTSPHARVDCVDCHIGKGFITTRITRKAGDAKHIISLAFKDYEFPITAEAMRPARDTCELCHFPEKFSDDSLREIKQYDHDVENTPSTTYLVMHTGGGSERLGLGQGIHWHVENPVYYYALDHREQDIPYVQVINDDGSASEYIDIESDFDPAQMEEGELKQMDCITCHNRITHMVNHPEDMIDRLLERGVISTDIPDIKRVAVEVLTRDFTTTGEALNAIAGIENFYAHYYPDFVDENGEMLSETISTLQETYTDSVYPEQKSDWNSHANNIGHQFSPGCFRCHDGKHLNQEQEAIRLECNICHSIPVVAEQYAFLSNIEISHGPEPESHLNPNWISMHRNVFDPTCQNCHTTEDPGGTSNTSFCANSACHGNVYEYAGFDAPGLREILLEQLPEIIEFPPETSEDTDDVEPAAAEGEAQDDAQEEVQEEVLLTFDDTIGPLFVASCSACHGENAMVGLDLTSYEATMKGSDNGPVVIAGDPAESSLVQVQSGPQPHFGQFSPQELEIVSGWIEAGAPEK